MNGGLILLGVVLGVILNNRGLLGWLPIVANFEYSVAVFKLKDKEQWLKLSFLVNMLMYSVFSFVIMNYIGAVANIVVAVTTAISLIRERKKRTNGKRTGRAVTEYKRGIVEQSLFFFTR